MGTHKIPLEPEGYTSLQTKKQQQAKKDKLAAALRDNLRRRKAIASSPIDIDDEGFSK